MKSILLLALGLFFCFATQAQCTIALEWTQNGNDVTATLTGSGTDTPTYAIDWGDGTQEAISSGTHTYTADGTYSLCGYLTDTNDPFGCNAQTCDEVVIGKGGSGCQMTWTPFVTGMTLGITASATGAVEAVYTINWGDGTADGTSNPSFHTYVTGGTYTVCVTYSDATNPDGCTIEQCTDVVIEDAGSPCEVTIALTQDGNTVSATATGTGAGSPQYAISWGDGTFPSLSASASHTYTTSGLYNVCATYLDLQNPQGCSASACQEVTITVGIFEFNQPVFNAVLAPNPADQQSRITFDLILPSTIQFEIYSMEGRLIQSFPSQSFAQGSQQWNIPTSTLESGMYQLRMLGGELQQTLPMIIQH